MTSDATGGRAAPGTTTRVTPKVDVDYVGQLLIQATLGEYDIYGELGRGGMASVYLGLDLSLGRKVAIKTMLPDLMAKEGMVERFKREAKTAAGLSHAHIIQIHSVKQSEDLVYFVMKFIEGRSLESVIRDKGQVPLAMAQTILTQVGSALDYAHRKGVVHRDVKPANIMIDEDGAAIVTDFGIAKVQEAQNLTATGTAIGTPHYMSPEQFHNEAVTGQSDQYSLGVVMYEMLGGQKPFDGRTYAEIITKHLFEPVPDLRTLNPGIPDHVVRVVEKMLSKDPKERYSDLDSAIHAFGAPISKSEVDKVRTDMITLAKSGAAARPRMSVPMSPVPVAKKSTTVQQASRSRRTWLTAAAGIVILGGTGYWGWLQLQTPSATSGSVAVSPAGAVRSPSADSSRAPMPSTAESSATAAPKIDTAKIVADLQARELQRMRDSVALERRRRAAESKAPAAPPAARDTVTRPTVQTEQPRAAKPDEGAIVIASPIPNAVLYINNVAHSAISSLQTIRVRAGDMRLSIKAEGCQPWDTTLTIVADSTHRIGRRPVRCR